MGENIVENYGWSSADGPHSCGYIAPGVVSLLKRLGVHRVLDLGSGNGKLCDELSHEGHEVVGVEYDRAGVALAHRSYPAVRFYNYGVHDDPEELMNSETAFDAVVSTEVIEHLFSPHFVPAVRTPNALPAAQAERLRGRRVFRHWPGAIPLEEHGDGRTRRATNFAAGVAVRSRPETR